jgi:DNA modification methylase
MELFTHDLRQGAPDIPQVDWIITDPPYGKEYLDVWNALGKVAPKILKEGGSLLAMGGCFHLPEYIKYLSQNLNYHWIINYNSPDYGYVIHPAKLQTRWKPIFWFTKGKYEGKYVTDLIRVSQGNIEKIHKWSQSVPVFREIIEGFTNRKDIIYDPCLGGGTTAIAAFDRVFYGSDNDSKCIALTQDHITKWLKLNCQQIRGILD